MTGAETRQLHVNSCGSGSAITFLHGFTQTSQSWNSLTQQLSDKYFCQSVDLPGHGESTDGRKSLQEIAQSVVSSTRPGALVGYSFGARVALHVALSSPEHVSKLVLISGTPGIEDDTERRQRRNSDNALATHIETIGVEQFIDEWLTLPLFNGLTESNNQRADRCRNVPTGLADSLRHAGTGTQQSLWKEIHNVDCPTLLVAGEDDAKFVDIARRMHALMPNSELNVVPAVGHTVHLEAPNEFRNILSSWLERHPN